MNIPTENLGEIHLYLRIGGNGSQITFKVENDSVRKYLLRNLIELKESVNRKDVLINVTLEPKENYSNPLSGVDLWI
jgi:flagellar hook-length control protein FliK